MIGINSEHPPYNHVQFTRIVGWNVIMKSRNDSTLQCLFVHSDKRRFDSRMGEIPGSSCCDSSVMMKKEADKQGMNEKHMKMRMSFGKAKMKKQSLNHPF